MFVRRIKKQTAETEQPEEPLPESVYPTFSELIKTAKLSKQQVAQLKLQWEQQVEQKIQDQIDELTAKFRDSAGTSMQQKSEQQFMGFLEQTHKSADPKADVIKKMLGVLNNS